MQILVGADPEIFLQENGKFISAHDKLPGTKWEPHIVSNGAIQVDGMAAEFNIDPAASEEEFLTNLQVVQDQLRVMLPGIDFIHAASVGFGEEFIKHIPSENLTLGCEPDFDAYTGGINPKPMATSLMRTAGGHVHIGAEELSSKNPYESYHFSSMCKLMQIMDEKVGVFSILWDRDDDRRKMYGKAGAFRPKSYGAEYRSLSNAWIFHRERQKFVYEGVQEAVKTLLSGEWIPDVRIPNIINNSLRDDPFFKGNQRAEYVMDVLA